MRIALLFAALVSSALVPAAAQAQVTPGQWDMTTSIQTMEMPDVPPAIAAMMRSRAIKTKHCITPEQAKLGPQEALKSDKSCRFDKYDLTAGKFSAVMSCTRGGRTMRTTSSGNFTPDAFTATGTTLGSDGMKMTSTTVGKRTRACK